MLEPSLGFLSTRCPIGPSGRAGGHSSMSKRDVRVCCWCIRPILIRLGMPATCVSSMSRKGKRAARETAIDSRSASRRKLSARHLAVRHVPDHSSSHLQVLGALLEHCVDIRQPHELATFHTRADASLELRIPGQLHQRCSPGALGAPAGGYGGPIRNARPGSGGSRRKAQSPDPVKTNFLGQFTPSTCPRDLAIFRAGSRSLFAIVKLPRRTKSLLIARDP
jgi:hypothetical protein